MRKQNKEQVKLQVKLGERMIQNDHAAWDMFIELGQDAVKRRDWQTVFNLHYNIQIGARKKMATLILDNMSYKSLYDSAQNALCVPIDKTVIVEAESKETFGGFFLWEATAILYNNTYLLRGVSSTRDEQPKFWYLKG